MHIMMKVRESPDVKSQIQSDSGIQNYSAVQHSFTRCFEPFAY